MSLPDLGVGIVFWPGLEPLLEPGTDLVNVCEVEPQAFWFETPGEPRSYRANSVAMERLRSLPQPKLVHGVGFPVGGSRQAGPHQLAPTLRAVHDLGAAWASEHLSFNRAGSDGRTFNTGFLLPPVQTSAGIEVAVDAVRQVAGKLPVPFAFETGVNYLRPRSGEIPDGCFVGSIAERADCGILLDLHNLWVNERNGRQAVRKYLEELPLERVWEVHLAGGLELDGFTIDAHSGAVPAPLAALAAEVLPELPELHALVFEVLPDYIRRFGLDGVREQLELLHRLWEGRERRRRPSRPSSRPRVVEMPEDDPGSPSPRQWEDALGALAIGHPCHEALADELRADPGVALLQRLVGEFRAGMVVDALKLTSRLLILTLGEAGYRKVLSEFWEKSPPEAFASTEAEAFARHLEGLRLEDALLPDVLAFERALIRARVEGLATTVHFRNDPAELLAALADGHLPASCPVGDFPVEISID